MVKHFAFLKNVCYQYLNFVLGVTHCFFYELLIGQQATFSECTLLFSGIRLVSFVLVAPVTVVVLQNKPLRTRSGGSKVC